jgi:hypothetical protein
MAAAVKEVIKLLVLIRDNCYYFYWRCVGLFTYVISYVGRIIKTLNDIRPTQPSSQSVSQALSPEDKAIGT